MLLLTCSPALAADASQPGLASVADGQYSVQLDARSVPVSEVAKQITSQTGVAFSYSETTGAIVLKDTHINIKGASIEQILKAAFSTENISWVIKDNMIGLYVKQKENAPDITSAKNSVPAPEKKYTISGKVTDIAGVPVPGAAIMVRNTTSGTLSGTDGFYSLKVSGKDSLVCRCIGYKDVEVQVADREKIDFSLEEDINLLEETVVVGYGTLKKTQLVGSVENLSGNVIEDRPNANLARSLQGQVAGLNIIQTDGKPTHSGAIYIRGNSTSYQSRPTFANSGKGDVTSYSIGTGGSALVLIDGVEGELSTINPADIETVAVLKDASSASIYGSKGCYGVILVTTKSAKNEKFSVTYSATASINSRIVKWEDNIVTDGLEWTEAFWEFFENQDRVPGGSGKAPTTINKSDVTLASGTYLEAFRERRANGDYSIYGGLGKKGQYIYYGSENYAADIYRRNTFSTTHDINMRGSSNKFKYSLAGRYQGQSGIYKVGNEDFKKLNLRVKTSLTIQPWLTLDNNTSFDYTDYTQPMWTASGAIGKQIDLNGQPVVPPFNEDGTYTRVGAVSSYGALRDGNTGQNSNNKTFSTTLGLNLDFIKNVLKLRTDFSYRTKIHIQERSLAPLQYSQSPGVMTDQTSQASSYKTHWENVTDHITGNMFLTWTPKFGDNHELNVVAGGNLEDYNYNAMYLKRFGMLFADMHDSFELFDGTEYNVTQSNSTYGIIGFFARANYTLMGRYIFELSARCDGSSKFPTNSRWGVFPSGSIGWRLSEEPWMKWAKGWMDNFKIRANYGTLGNGAISPFTFLETMDISKSSVILDGEKRNMTSLPNTIPTDLTWERVTTYDIGIDSDFLKNRLSFSGDIYVRNTDGLITVGTELPAFYGASAPKGNFAALQAKGWEVTLAWKDNFKLFGKPFSYNIKGSLWDTRTFVTKYTTLSENVLGFYTGKELGELWGFRTDGYFLSNEEARAWAEDSFHRNGNLYTAYAGDLKFLDLDKSGKIDYGAGTLSNHGDVDVIGNVTPRYQYGINLGANWNGIGVSAFFQGVGHRDWYPPIETALFYGMYNRVYSGWFPKNQTGDNYVHIDYSTENWTVTNADKNPYWTRRVGYAAYYGCSVMALENDYYLQNAAYIRLKNLTIDYSIPEKVLKNTKVSQARFYVSMENLWTWSPMFKYTRNFDPEGIFIGDSDFSSDTELYTVGAGYSYPMLKTFTLGLNLTF